MTEITKTIPGYNPADVNSLEGLNDILQDKISQNIQKICPGTVQSYDRHSNRASVKPAITGIATQGQKIPKETLIDVPVFCFAGGDIAMSFPVKAGDTGWLMACDRNISIFKQNLQESAPNDYRKHDFKDAFFFPDKINDINISDDDEGAFVLQALNQTSKITLKEDNIQLITNSGSTKIELDGENILAASTKIDITSTLTVTGTITADGLADTTAATGTFTSADGKVIVVTAGIVKSITG